MDLSGGSKSDVASVDADLGRFCGSLALKGRDYCYHHLRERGPRLKMARARARGERLPLQLPLLEDMYAVQVSIMLVTDRLLNGKLDRRDASLALYGLQQAATNLARCLLPQ